MKVETEKIVTLSDRETTEELQKYLSTLTRDEVNEIILLSSAYIFSLLGENCFYYHLDLTLTLFHLLVNKCDYSCFPKR